MARARVAKIDRRSALHGRPLRLPVIETKERPQGGLMVTVTVRPKRWQRWLGFPTSLQRTYGLDLAGRQVYEACDGYASVTQIIRRFARNNRLQQSEAEAAVTAFLKSLIGRGLVVMQVKRPAAQMTSSTEGARSRT